jgi:hypothetical protein
VPGDRDDSDPVCHGGVLGLTNDHTSSNSSGLPPCGAMWSTRSSGHKTSEIVTASFYDATAGGSQVRRTPAVTGRSEHREPRSGTLRSSARLHPRPPSMS